MCNNIQVLSYEPKRVAHHSLSKSSLSAKDKRSPLMNSENDLLQPNTGDIPMETLNHIRKHIIHLILHYLVKRFNLEQSRLKPIPLSEFHVHVNKMHENRDYGFEVEYQVSVHHSMLMNCVFNNNIFLLEYWFGTCCIL